MRRRRKEVVVASVEEGPMKFQLRRTGDAVAFFGEVGEITCLLHSPGKESHPLLLIGLGCGLKESEILRPIYEAMKKIVEEDEA